jgi:hypothetical protein
MSIDGLLVALLVVLAPDQDPNAERALDSLSADPQTQRQAPADAAACRMFVDIEARRKCTIRMSRPAASGTAEPTLSFPESVIWMAPAEPTMPYKFYSPPPR